MLRKSVCRRYTVLYRFPPPANCIETPILLVEEKAGSVNLDESSASTGLVGKCSTQNEGENYEFRKCVK